MKVIYLVIPIIRCHTLYSPWSTKSSSDRFNSPTASLAVYRFLRSSVMAAKMAIKIKKNLKVILISNPVNLHNLWQTPTQPGAMGGVK